MVIWMYSGLIIHWFSFISGIKLKLANADVHGDFGSASIFNVVNSRKKKKIF